MAKRKHSADWMLARVREYLSGKGSYRQIARANGISEQSLRDWVRKYEKQGEASFIERAGNASYSKEFKASCVLAVLRGEGSVDDIVAKYNNELIVVEVKSRKDIRFGNPEEAVNDRKIRHIIASTDAYLRKFAIDLPVRFDIITVVGQEAPFQIEHIADAFYSPIW